MSCSCPGRLLEEMQEEGWIDSGTRSVGGWIVYVRTRYDRRKVHGVTKLNTLFQLVKQTNCKHIHYIYVETMCFFARSRIAGIKHECSLHKGLIRCPACNHGPICMHEHTHQILFHPGLLRRDKYEKHVKLYWVEKAMQGKTLTLGFFYFGPGCCFQQKWSCEWKNYVIQIARSQSFHSGNGSDTCWRRRNQWMRTSTTSWKKLIPIWCRVILNYLKTPQASVYGCSMGFMYLWSTSELKQYCLGPC